jgi:quercetin dioxygenase-like cupin family protein
MKAFSKYEFGNGKIADLDKKFPSYLTSWNHWIELPEGDTHYVYVYQGTALVQYNGAFYQLEAGMYGCFPSNIDIVGGAGIAISRKRFHGMFSIGGKIEETGRLKYIDGCTDSLLIPPVMMGDPCLNALFFPQGIDQTAHTHPSERIGIVISGKGRCVSQEEDGEKVTELVAGTVFAIHAEGVHKFQTPYEEGMKVLAYHPDSDYGPTHQFHPMLNRTMVDGVSANQISSIQTK